MNLCQSKSTFAGTMLIICACCKMDEGTGQQPINLNASDSNFLIHATYSHLAEIDAGNLAARKATADSIKMFGQMMVSDHTAAQNSLDSTANYVDIPIPKMLDLAHRALAQLLSSLSGHAFDSAYIKSRIAEHKTALRLFKTEIDHGVNIRIKSYASNYLPKI